MSKNKKYYWLKLKQNFFEEDAISWLEEQEKGKEYCLFYLKLCLKTLNTNGLLIRNVGNMLVPYDPKTLGKITNTDTDTVRVAMDILTKIGLVQILENGEIFIEQVGNMVGSETSKAQLMRNKRKREKELLNNSGNNVTKKLPTCYSSEEHCYIEKEIDKEIEIDKDKEQDTEKDSIVVVNCFRYIQQVGIPLTQYHHQEIITFIEDGIEEDLIIKAIDITVGNGKRSYAYIKGILNKWIENDIKTVKQLEIHESEYKNKKIEKGAKDDGYDYQAYFDSRDKKEI